VVIVHDPALIWSLEQYQFALGPLNVLGVNVYADCALIAVDGITIEKGLSACRLEVVLVSAAAVGSARRAIALAPSGAFGQNALAGIGPLGCVQVLVTDRVLLSSLHDALASAGVDVVVADE
jgi:DeoR/GlpR family transcriptional regulator of sugar metabolism